MGYNSISTAEWSIHMNLPLSERTNVTSTLPRSYRALLKVSVVTQQVPPRNDVIIWTFFTKLNRLKKLPAMSLNILHVYAFQRMEFDYQSCVTKDGGLKFNADVL